MITVVVLFHLVEHCLSLWYLVFLSLYLCVYHDCVVPENIHTPRGRLLEIPWEWGSRGANFQGVWGVRRVIYFQRVQEHCLRKTYQYRIYDLINQQIDELQRILVYSNVICTFSGHF